MILTPPSIMSSSDIPSSTVIRASEVGQWIYCHRAWWLAREGYTNQNQTELQAGIVAHEHHAQEVAQAHKLHAIAIYLFILSLLLFAATLLASHLSLI
ncbi:MAG: hypothetical protein GXP38_15655 [Chloroflexi bacterium]|nr:hypothetical protein [Chloroflexota bacterium]